MRVLFHPLTMCFALGLAGCGVSSAVVEGPDGSRDQSTAEESIQLVVDGPGSRTATDDAKEDAPGFPFPDDRAGQLLSKLLPPSEKSSPAAHDAPAPRHLPPPAHLEQPSPPLPPGQADMPRLPAAKPQSLRPRPLPEELPLLGHESDPLVPQSFHAGDRVRLPSVDVNQPVPLPILAQPVTNRAPLDDATADASLNAALSATPPTRATPAPFIKLNLPDPFENRLKPSPAPPEEVAPTHTGSRPAR